MKIHDKNNREDLLTFVTIFFFGELPNLLLQARSLSLYGSQAIKKWIIVFNDDITALEKEQIFKSLYRELKNASFDVFWMERTEITDIDLSQMNGSRSQQILKICVSSFVDDKFFVMLDAKNHAIRKLKPEFFIVDNLPVVHRQEYEDWNEFYRFFKKAFGLFGLTEDKNTFEKYQSTTPYVMKTDLVKRCMEVKFISSREPWNHFVSLMNDNPDSITEFSLYAAVAELFEIKTFITEKQYVTLFDGWPRDPSDIIRSINEIGNKKIRFFGVHRNRGFTLSAEESLCLAKQWVDRGLFLNIENGTAFLRKNPLENYRLPE